MWTNASLCIVLSNIIRWLISGTTLYIIYAKHSIFVVLKIDISPGSELDTEREKSSAKSESLAISLCWKGYIVNEKEEEGRTEDGTLDHAFNFNNKGLRWGVGPHKPRQILSKFEIVGAVPK